MTAAQNQTNNEIKEEIRSRIDIAQVIGKYVTLKPAGQNLKGLCPFHKEKSPSFTVNPEKRIFYCFGCGKGGDIYTFLMEKEGLTFPEALENLAQETGIELQTLRQTHLSATQHTISKTEALKIHEIATDYYYNQIRKNPEAIAYFKTRKLTPLMVKEFRLGYAPEGWNNLVSHCASISINTEKLAACGLVVTSATAAYDRFRNRVMFPIFDISGKPIAFGGRALDNETKPKYLNSSETILYQKNRVLYGLSHARATIKEKGYVIFVEGYMDFLSLYQAGIKNAVATSGTALTEEHGHLIRRFTSKIVLVFDGDNAGVAAAERAIFILLPLNLDVCVLVLPQEHDPDTFIQEFSTTVFLEKIAQAETGIRFYLKRIMQQYDAKSATGKSEVIHHIAPLIKALSDEIVRAEVIKEVSQELGIKETILYSKLKPVLKNLGTESTQQPSPMAAQKLLATEEGHFLQILVKDPSLIPTVLKYISSETFLENNSGKLYSLITETFSVDKTLQTLFSRTTDGELRQILSLMAVKELPPGDLNEEITHKVKRFILKVYTAKKHQITQLIRKENNQELKAKLLQKQNDLITKYGAISKEW